MWQIINNFLGNIIVMLGVSKFSQITLDKSHSCLSRKKYIASIILSVLLYTIVMYYFNDIMKTILFIVIIYMFNKYVFKEKNKKVLSLTIIYTILLLLIDIFVLLFVTEILSMSKDYCYNVFAGSILGNSITQFLILIITIFFKKTFNKINDNISTSIKTIIYALFTLISSAMFLYMIVRDYRLSDDIYLYFISIIVLMMGLFGFMKQSIITSKINEKYGNLMELMTKYEIDVENERILRHEATNELRTIRAMICEKQPVKEIVEYIDEIVKDKYEVKKEKYAKFGYLPPNGIKGLFYFKTQEAENKGINVSINISKKIINSTLYSLSIKQQRDLGRILGVFLDNAIEASIESSVKQLGIEAYVNEENEFKLILSNTYNNVIDKKRIGLERFSTKGNNRGRGLLLVKILVDKNEIFEIKNNIQENIYIQTIIIKNNQ